MGEMTQLEYVLKGLKRKSQTTSRMRLPIILDILERMRQVWQHHSEPGDVVMFWAAATMCFFGFLRSGEVTVPGDRGFDPTRHLVFGDVRLSSHQDPQFVVVQIKASKTDPYRQGGVNLLWANPRRAVPRGSCTQLHGPVGDMGRALLPLQGQQATYKGTICRCSSEGTDNCRLKCLAVCGTQLPQRSGNNSGTAGYPGLPHQNPRQMGKDGRHTLCTLRPHPRYSKV